MKALISTTAFVIAGVAATAAELPPATVSQKAALEAKIEDVNSKITTIDSMINSTDNRLRTYSSLDLANKTTATFSIQAEKQNYESQKLKLEDQRAELERELKSLQ